MIMEWWGNELEQKKFSENLVIFLDNRLSFDEKVPWRNVFNPGSKKPGGGEGLEEVE